MTNHENDTTSLATVILDELDDVRGGIPEWLKRCGRGAAVLGGAGALQGATVFGAATLFQPVGSALVGAAVGAGIGGGIGATVGCASGALGAWSR